MAQNYSSASLVKFLYHIDLERRLMHDKQMELTLYPLYAAWILIAEMWA